MLIETERLFLRPWREGDAEGARSVYCDPEVRFFTGGALAPENVNEFIRGRIEHYMRGELRLLPLIEKDSARIIGSCGLQPLLLNGAPEIEIGWMLVQNARHRGYATEMSQAILRHALNEMKLSRVLATIDPRNYRSVRVANRLGMQFSKVVHTYGRDMNCYEALWQRIAPSVWEG